VHVLGIPVDCVDMGRALETVDAMVRGGRPQTILAVNPEKIMRAQSDPVLCDTLIAAGLVIPDGIGVVYAVRLLWNEPIGRVAGADLMPEICAQASRRGYRIFLFGAKPEVNAQAVAVLRERYPGINIVGHRDGYIKEEQMPELIDAINASCAQVLFVALGSPRQELWMQKYLPMLVHVRVCQGVGGTFDVIAGRVYRAPEIVRRANFEWLYRLITEPRRAFRQAVIPKFTLAVFRAKLSGRP
jgi:N-acetylglucosaminyldiphosphoundecaprenol N-acetyl-beta-D-mannosaminyltransferase